MLSLGAPAPPRDPCFRMCLESGYLEGFGVYDSFRFEVLAAYDSPSRFMMDSG